MFTQIDRRLEVFQSVFLEQCSKNSTIQNGKRTFLDIEEHFY